LPTTSLARYTDQSRNPRHYYSVAIDYFDRIVRCRIHRRDDGYKGHKAVDKEPIVPAWKPARCTYYEYGQLHSNVDCVRDRHLNRLAYRGRYLQEELENAVAAVVVASSQAASRWRRGPPVLGKLLVLAYLLGWLALGVSLYAFWWEWSAAVKYTLAVIEAILAPDLASIRSAFRGARS